MSLKCNIKTVSKRRRIKGHVATSIQADLWLQQRQREKNCCITEISQCHSFNLSGGGKASASECITTSRPNVAACFNEIMTKSQRLAIWLGVKDRQCTGLCEEDNNRRKEVSPRDRGHDGWLKEGGKGEAVEASLPHDAMAACSAAADTKWSRESWDGKGREGGGGKWGGGGNGDSKDSNAERGEQETVYRKIIISPPSGHPPLLWPWI